MFDSIHIIRKLQSEDDPLVESIDRGIQQIASDCNMPVVDKTQLQPGTLIFSIGGDGTMLEAMRRSAFSGATAVGINLGRVGFLSDISVERVGTEVVNNSSLAQSIYSAMLIPGIIEPRTVLTSSEPGNHLACNEISISAKYSDTMIIYDLYINGISAGTHRANSVIISTATGSTAYSLSAGGSIMMPTLDVMQIIPVAPITLTSRPIVVGAESEIVINVHGSELSIRSDGQLINSIDNQKIPHQVKIFPYPFKANVLHALGWSFFDMLTQKLKWNIT